MDDSTALWDDRQVANYFGISVRSVQRWRSEGSGPKYIRLGPNCVRYKPEEIAAYSASRTFDCRAAELAAA